MRTILCLLACLATTLLIGCEFGLSSTSPADGQDESLPDDDTQDDDTQDDDDAQDDDAQDDDDVQDDDDTLPAEDDWDGDGWAESEDCNDHDAQVHPSASEVACDGKDNDCDGQFLPDDQDVDGDGYSGCLGDCDDSDASIGVHGAEVECDGIDQDCQDGDLCGGDPSDPDPDPDPDPAASVCADPLVYGAAGGAPAGGALDPADPVYGSTGSWYFETWTVSVPSAGVWYIDLTSADFDAWVEVYDSACNFVGYDDDSCGWLSSDACFDYDSATGGESIFVLATSYGELETGSYSLEIW